jgi:aromatase
MMERATAERGDHFTVHHAAVSAPASLLYELVVGADAAPMVFGGTVHVERLHQAPGEERLRIWAAYGEQLRTWTTHRRLDPDRLSVTFQQDVPEPPMAFMRGEWRLQRVRDDLTQVSLSHTFRAVDDDPANVTWIEDLTDRVSTGQLTSLGDFAALGAEARFVVEHSARLRCPVDTAYAFVRNTVGWVGVLPQVETATLRASKGQMQLVDLTIRQDGDERSSRVARVCCPGTHIAFKNLTPQPPVVAHVGSWHFESTADGTVVRLEHRVAVHDATGDAQAQVREAIHAASTILLRRLTEL